MSLGAYFAVLLALAAGCAAPPVLTPTRIADRSIAPLARTAEVRLYPSVQFEQRRPPYRAARRVSFDLNDRAVHANPVVTYAFSDRLALVIPGALLWSLVVDPEQGYWLTLGGGIQGVGVARDYTTVTSFAGIWGKHRSGPTWITLGLALMYNYYREGADRRQDAWSDHSTILIPGAELGLQSGDHWALSIQVDHGISLGGDRIPYSRLLAGVTVVPVWWLDLGLYSGGYVHRYPDSHFDPALALSVAARW
ncbi:MAG TPA: hypothetical protein VFG30_01660 [Polyangiales bacterium]|nr:hypothetical protein [Polyangiales bacterium]